MFSCEFNKFSWVAIFHNILKCNFSLYFIFLNPFKVNLPFVYPLKPSENQRFSDVSEGMHMEHWIEKRQTTYFHEHSYTAGTCSHYINKFTNHELIGFSA